MNLEHYLSAFNGGLLDSKLDGRTDIDVYAKGLTECTNFAPLPHGPLSTLPQTKMVGLETAVWFAKFVFNATQQYVLAFGDSELRFYTDGAIVESTPGTPYVLTTPWPASVLTTSQGTFALRMVQSGDVIYVTHPDYAPRVLTRLGAASWSVSEFSPIGGPFENVDPDETVTVYASAATGTWTTAGTGVALTASASLFASTDVGRLFLLENKKIDAILQWESGKGIAANDLRRSDGKTYKALAAGTTAGVIPIHEYGARYDGDTTASVQWEYQDPGYGWVLIEEFISATVVRGTVLSSLPYGSVGSGQATTRWAFGEWKSGSYPDQVTFYSDRLVFGRSLDAKLWFSVVGGYDDFRDRNLSGEVALDQAVTLTITSDQVNAIRWLIPERVLMVGTESGVHVVDKITDNEAFGAGNARAEKVSNIGCRDLVPVRGDGEVIFADITGRGIYALRYSYADDAYSTSELTLLWKDQMEIDGPPRQLEWTNEPYPILWILHSNGAVHGVVKDRTQGVVAAFRYTSSASSISNANAVIKSIVAIVEESTGYPQLWTSVFRNPLYTVEYMSLRRFGKRLQTSDTANELYTFDGAQYHSIEGTGTILDLQEYASKTVRVFRYVGTTWTDEGSFAVDATGRLSPWPVDTGYIFVAAATGATGTIGVDGLVTGLTDYAGTTVNVLRNGTPVGTYSVDGAGVMDMSPAISGTVFVSSVAVTSAAGSGGKVAGFTDYVGVSCLVFYSTAEFSGFAALSEPQTILTGGYVYLSSVYTGYLLIGYPRTALAATTRMDAKTQAAPTIQMRRKRTLRAMVRVVDTRDAVVSTSYIGAIGGASNLTLDGLYGAQPAGGDAPEFGNGLSLISGDVPVTFNSANETDAKLYFFAKGLYPVRITSALVELEVGKW